MKEYFYYFFSYENRSDTTLSIKNTYEVLSKCFQWRLI
jgi:hypothetical protein